MIARYSSAIAPRSENGRPRSLNSASSQPTPMPKMKRPPETWSTVAAAFAATSGLRYGSTITLAPTWIRLVRPARKARSENGSGQDGP